MPPRSGAATGPAAGPGSWLLDGRSPLADFLEPGGRFAVAGFEEERPFVEQSRQPGQTALLITPADLHEHLAAIQVGFAVVIAEGDRVLGPPLVEQVANQE